MTLTKGQRLLTGASFLLLVVVVGACKQSLPEQVSAVRTFDRHSERIRIACLDVNRDGMVDAADADPVKLPDITGDGVRDESDLAVLRQVNLALPDGRPTGCGGTKSTDWQVGPPAQVDCRAGKSGFIVYGVGGGAVDLDNDTNAAGVRWMLVRIGQLLDALDVPHQLISMAPGLNSTADPQPDSERWAAAYLTAQLSKSPCLQVIMIGHSHGATSVTATASRLENAGLGKQVALCALIDRVTALYAGDTESIPQSAPVFNVYLTLGEQYQGEEIDQANVANWDATGQLAPQRGEKGGPLQPATHTTIDNSPAVLNEIAVRVVQLPFLQER